MTIEKPLSPAAATRAAYIRGIVDSIPPLTDAQKAHIAGLLMQDPPAAPRAVEPRTGTRTAGSEPLPRTFYTPREVAASTGLSYKKVLAMCAAHRLRHIREGQSIRIPVAALDELAASAS